MGGLCTMRGRERGARSRELKSEAQRGRMPHPARTAPIIADRASAARAIAAVVRFVLPIIFPPRSFCRKRRSLVPYLYRSYHLLTHASIYTMRLALCEKTRNLSRADENRA